MNNKIQLISKNIISFNRVKSKHCTKYEIYAIYENESKSNEYLLDTIENPKTPTPHKKAINLEYNSKKKWELNDNIIAKSSSDIIVYINNTRLNTGEYTYSPYLKVLNVHINLNEKCVIKIEYNVDTIEYTHDTSKRHKYRIVPVFKSYNIGQHSILNNKETYL